MMKYPEILERSNISPTVAVLAILAFIVFIWTSFLPGVAEVKKWNRPKMACSNENHLRKGLLVIDYHSSDTEIFSSGNPYLSIGAQGGLKVEVRAGSDPYNINAESLYRLNKWPAKKDPEPLGSVLKTLTLDKHAQLRDDITNGSLWVDFDERSLTWRRLDGSLVSYKCF